MPVLFMVPLLTRLTVRGGRGPGIRSASDPCRTGGGGGGGGEPGVVVFCKPVSGYPCIRTLCNVVGQVWLPDSMGEIEGTFGEEPGAFMLGLKSSRFFP